jgi:NADPH:quinone reductase-like Zn-dependent oxidoreductase
VRDILPGIGSGRVTPLVDSVFEFSQLPAARDRMLSNLQVGKIILLAP